LQGLAQLAAARQAARELLATVQAEVSPRRRRRAKVAGEGTEVPPTGSASRETGPAAA
jgi:hypothetical protein